MSGAGANATVAERLAASLRRHGVTDVFGQSLPSAVMLAAPRFGVRQVAYRAENAGAAMADAYARASNKVGVVAAQNGPAATLLVPGLAEAFKASIPVVALVQDVPRANLDRNAFQELDHRALFSGVAKWVRRLEDGSRVEAYVDMAFAAAAGGRGGPAVLLLPADVLNERAGPDPVGPERSAGLGAFPLERPVADSARVAEAADLLAKAEAPLVVAGGGVHASGAAEALAALQELGLPVATTVMGKGGVDETHPLSVGVVGYFMAPGSRAGHLRGMVEGADVVLLVGNRANQNGTDSWRLYPPNARYVQIDVDPSEVGRNFEALRLVGDAKATLEALTAALTQRDLSDLRARRGGVEARIAKAREAHRADLARLVAMDQTPIRPERLMADLDAALTPESVVVADASYASIWVANFLTVRRAGQRFLTPRGLAGLGWGLPFALGAKAARPEAPVVCVTGDGGFAHVWAELETSRRMKLPVTVVVLDNRILGYQKHAELVLFGDHTDACDFEPVDHAALARACGCEGVTVERPGHFAPALERAMATPATTVLDVKIDPNAHPPITAFEGELDLPAA